MKTIKIIPSKSDAHRAYICATLSGTPCQVICDATSKDIEATKACLAAIEDTLAGKTKIAELPCGESGSTFRFLIPVVAALGIEGHFHMEGRLPERPLSPMYEELVAHGAELSPQGENPFVVKGQLTSGVYEIAGNVSSQFISGLLFALPLLEGDSEIRITTELQSKGYVDMTLSTIARFGIKILVEEPDCTKDGSCSFITYRIPGGQKYRTMSSYQVEGDWSNAAFWLAAGAISDYAVWVDGLNNKSIQGDRKIVPILRRFGVTVEQHDDEVVTYPSRQALHGITIDVGEIPDMVPSLALIASLAKGETKIVNASRLRVKESDRLATIAETLRLLGADIEELEDGLIIRGKDALTGGVVDSHNDHRIAMMAGIASIVSSSDVEIKGANAVTKSYPGFFEELYRQFPAAKCIEK